LIKAATLVSLYLSEHTLFLNMSLHQGDNEDPVWVDRGNFAEILPKFCRNFADGHLSGKYLPAEFSPIGGAKHSGGLLNILINNLYAGILRPRLKIQAIALVTEEAIANIDGTYRGEMPQSEKLNLKFF
jgi:hypothetical protein